MIERIYIPTVRRADNQITYNCFPDELKKRVVMVVEPNERSLYDYDCEYLEIPKEIVGTWTQLAETRLFIHKHAGSIKYVMADDDLFIKRRNSRYWSDTSNMETSRRSTTKEEIIEMFDIFDKWLDEDDIGVAGLSNTSEFPRDAEYTDTAGTFGFVFLDGRMISKEIDDMDITTTRVSEDLMFIYECLSRGINSRSSTEWVYDNGSMCSNKLKNTRLVWEGMYEGEQPEDHFQTDEHYDALKYIQKKFPHGIKLFEKDGRRKNKKYWKKVYVPKNSSSLSALMS